MNHRPRKRFGQHFLVDPTIVERIVRTIAPKANECLFEIGPGPGVLTQPLTGSGANLIAVEIDRDLAARLQGDIPSIEVLNEDALEVDFAALAAGRTYRLVGNLPYNISTPLMFHVLDQSPPPGDMHFMLQREVAQRLAAEPGTGDYGRLTVMTRNRCEVARLFDVPPEAFEPRPAVESAFVRLSPRTEPLVPADLEESFARVVAQAFSMRRKTLRNSLRNLVSDEAMRAAGIDPGERAESLSVGEFATLAKIHLSQSPGRAV